MTAAAYGLSFDHDMPGPSPATSHASWNTRFGATTPVRPVSIRISSLSGAAFMSPHRIGGYSRGRHSWMNAPIASTCRWRTTLWSNRQLRWVQNAWIGPRGPSISANSTVRRSSGSSAAGSGRQSVRRIGQRLTIALPEWTGPSSLHDEACTNPSRSATRAAMLVSSADQTSCRQATSGSRAAIVETIAG